MRSRLLGIALLSLLALVNVPREGLAAPAGAVDMGLRSAELAGQPIAELRFEGAAPRTLKAVEALVDLKPGDLWSAQRIGRALRLVFRLGQFDDVQVRAERGPRGLTVTFMVAPSPRICRIDLLGARSIGGGILRAALSHSANDRYVPQDEQRSARQVEAAYRDRGFLDVRAQAELGRCAVRRGKRLVIRVDEGTPYRIADVTLPAPSLAGFAEPKIRRMLGPGLAAGRIYRRKRLERGIERLRVAYLDEGFIELRFLRGAASRPGELPVPVEVDRDARTVTIPLAFDAGPWVQPRFTFYGARLPPWTDARLRRVIGLEEARRATPAYAEEAGRQLVRFLADRGFYSAQVVSDVRDEALPRTGVPAPEQPQRDSVRLLDFRVQTEPQHVWRDRDFTIEGAPELARRGDPTGRRQALQIISASSPAVLGHRPVFWQVIGLGQARDRRFYTDEAMAGALRVLRDWYRARGFLAAEASHSVDQVAGPSETRRLRIAVVVDEGPRTTVESLEVLREGQGDADPGPAWQAQVERWRAGVEDRPFNPEAVAALAQEARRLLSGQGYLDATAEMTQELSEDGALVRLRLVVRPGQLVQVGQVLVRDNRHTVGGLIRREAALPPGSILSPRALTTAQERLLRTGLFEGVVTRPAQSSGRVRDVLVAVRERNRLHFAGGVGVTGPDDGPRVSGELRLRNLDGRGLSVFARGRMSIDWRFFAAGLPPIPEYRATLGVELPHSVDFPFRLAITGVLGDEIDEPTFRLRRHSLGAALTSRGLAKDRFTLGLRGELQLRAPLRVDPAAVLSQTWDTPTDKPAQDFKVVPMAGLTLAVDQRYPNALNPVYGLYAVGTVDSTLGNSPTNQAGFGQATGRLLGLVPFGRDSSVGLRLEGAGGLAWSYGGELPPVEWRFRLGGNGTVRGYLLDSIGPTGTRPSLLAQDGLLQGAHDPRTITVGGTAFYRYSVELTWPLGPGASWKMALFHDGGNALLLGTPPEGIDDNRSPILHTSVGLGIRRVTPIGPLRLDVAVRPDSLAALPAGSFADVLRLHFAIGAL